MQYMGAEQSICLHALVLAAAYDPCKLEWDSETEKQGKQKHGKHRRASMVARPLFFVFLTPMSQAQPYPMLSVIHPFSRF